MTDTPLPGDAAEQHRRCVFDLWLTCGHIATVIVEGWYPVWVPCCDRLGGTVARGVYVPYASLVDYVQLLSESYDVRPAGTPRAPITVLHRRPRTDDPSRPGDGWSEPTAGRYPAWVGAARTFDDPPAAGGTAR